MSNFCYCCGKPLENGKYHPSCIRKFFGTTVIPKIEINKEILEEQALQFVKKNQTVTGVQKKLSLHLDSSGKSPRLTLVGYPAGYILKPESSEYPFLPQSEFVVMKLAEMFKIRTVPSMLLELEDGSFAYITKRIDRDGDRKIHMEDFCQLSERLTEDKYKGSYEQCGKIISKYSAIPLADKTDFFNRVFFSWLMGNNDMHLKNFSLIQNESGFVLSPAYDLLPVRLVAPFDTEELALNLNGKKNRIKKSDFLSLAKSLEISETVAEKMMNRALETLGKINMDFVKFFLGEEKCGDFKKMLFEKISVMAE